MSFDIQTSELVCKKLKVDLNGVGDFISSKEQFTEYFQVHAYNDQKEQTGQTWVFMHSGKIVGFTTIAMAYMKKSECEELAIDSFGNIPALLIGHLATHKDFERQGIDKYMVSWAINKAIDYSESIGCRLVILNPESDVIDFYKKRGFAYVPPDDGESASMFFDIK